MHDLMIRLLYYDVEAFIFPCLGFLSIVAFRKAINTFGGGGVTDVVLVNTILLHGLRCVFVLRFYGRRGVV
jgi:hypothetical protein